MTLNGVNIIVPTKNKEYATMSGTSIAAAHTAGLAAMLLEWGKIKGNIKYLDGTDIKILFIRGAKRDPDADYPNREWGFGIIDILGTFENISGNF
jgi:hypothetical protein